VIVACGDANFRLAKAQWKGWNTTVATGRAVARANTCNPDCASGHDVSYKVRVRAYRVRRCEDTGKYQYTRLRITFVGSKPSGPRRFVAAFNFCQ
jgi:hypothetical protein